MPAPLQLTGMRFGKWVVVSQTDKPRPTSIGTYWICMCECGDKSVVSGGTLTSQSSTQCRKCANEARSIGKQWIKDNQGKHFCQCGCGQPISIKIHHHTRGISKYIDHHQPCKLKTCCGEDNPHFKEGRYVNQSGYILVLVPGPGKSRYILEHRLVVEAHLGRKLKDGEVIHHINGIKTDNRLSNLQIMTNSEHTALHAKNGEVGFRYHRKWGKVRRVAS